MKDDPTEVSRYRKQRKKEAEKGALTGAKRLENGTPPLQAKAQSCQDAAARPAIQAAV